MALASAIRRRAVFYVGGYDPKTPAAFFERLDRERARYEKLWAVETERGAVRDRDGVAASSVTAKSSAWSVETDMHFFSLETIVQRDFADPIFVRFARYLVTFVDYVVSGTVFGFFRTNWRFAGYFLYPFVMALLLATALLIPSFWLFFLVPNEGAFAAAGGTALRNGVFALAGLLFFFLLAKLGPRWFVPHLMDLWSFSRNWIRERRPDAEKLFDRYGRITARAAETGD